MDQSFQYTFPAIRGFQAGREYFASMCPMRLIPRIFIFDDEELKPEFRAQRTLNRGRIPEMSSYLVDNDQNYVFSALTASIDADVTFEVVNEDKFQDIGLLHIPMSARFVINDGQHRRAAIEMALREKPELGDETIAVVFFLDVGLSRCQQMFADLNRHAIRPSRSLGILYDHRDDKAQLSRLVAIKSKVFRDLVEMERSTLSQRAQKLFTLSAIYTGISALLAKRGDDGEDLVEIAIDYWDHVAVQLPEWSAVQRREITAGEVRRDFIHSHALTLHALGIVGNGLLAEHPEDWTERLKVLAEIDWSRNASEVWEGRALVGGKLTKSRQNVLLTSSLLKQKLGIALSDEEQRAEDAFQGGKNGHTAV